MKITKNRLKQLIEQEVKSLLEEPYDQYRDQQKMDSPIPRHSGGRYATDEEAISAGYDDGASGRERASKDEKYNYGYDIGEEDRGGMQEGVENITPENIQLALEALKQMGITFSPIVAGATVMGIYDLVKDKLTKPDAEDE